MGLCSCPLPRDSGCQLLSPLWSQLSHWDRCPFPILLPQHHARSTASEQDIATVELSFCRFYLCPWAACVICPGITGFSLWKNRAHGPPDVGRIKVHRVMTGRFRSQPTPVPFATSAPLNSPCTHWSALAAALSDHMSPPPHASFPNSGSSPELLRPFLLGLCGWKILVWDFQIRVPDPHENHRVLTLKTWMSGRHPSQSLGLCTRRRELSQGFYRTPRHEATGCFMRW